MKPPVPQAKSIAVPILIQFNAYTKNAPTLGASVNSLGARAKKNGTTSFQRSAVVIRVIGMYNQPSIFLVALEAPGRETGVASPTAITFPQFLKMPSIVSLATLVLSLLAMHILSVSTLSCSINN